MSDSEDDAAGAALPRQKSIFSTMGRVRNMNQLREKWTARAKLSSSSGTSELEVSSSGTAAAASVGATYLKKRASPASNSRLTSSTAETTAASVPPKKPTASSAVSETRGKTMTPMEAQRFAALTAWLRRSGLVVPPEGDGDAFDSLFASLDEIETAVKHELALLWPPPPTEMTTPRVPHGSSSPSFVDYTVVIGPDIADLATHAYWLGQENVYEATVVFAHPPQSQFNAECIEQFCFPRGVATGSAHEPELSDEFYVLVLSGGGDQGQSVQYACCLRKHIVIHGSSAEDVTAAGSTTLVPVCYAVVVSVPWIPFFRQLLRHLAARHQEDLWKLKSDELQSTIVPDTLAQHIDSMMTALACMELPARGEELRFAWSPNTPTFACVRPRIDCGAPETVTLLLDWATRQLLSVLSIERLIMVIGLLLIEMKIVVVSRSMPLLSAGTVGLAALLYPLAWAGPLISILPPALHEYLEAPVPLLCGVDVLPDQFVLTKGTAILAMDKDEVQLHPDDTAQMGALQFPGSDGLSRQLRVFADRLLSVSPNDQSRTVVANFVARRIRRQLQDLVLLCARVNPCNAYACMKQEQLSLSETLFLKSFMQSQMYQKYSDDQAPNQFPESNDKIDQPREHSAQIVDASSPSVPISKQLAPSIKELFMLAMTGSCSHEHLAHSSHQENESSVNDPDVEVDDEAANRAGYSEELSIKSSRSSHSSSTSSSPLEGGRRESVGVSQDLTEPKESPPIRNVGEALKHTQWAHSLPRVPQCFDTHDAGEAVRDDHEPKPHSTPVSPEKPPDNTKLGSSDGVRHNAARSMPDVLVIPDETRPPGRAETESFVAMASLTSAVSDPDAGGPQQIRFGSSRGHPRGSRPQSELAQLSQNLAATKIQFAWRKRHQRLLSAHRTASSRALSLASAGSASDTTFPSSVGEWTPAELLFGTMLSIRTERGRIVDVRMRLSTDAKQLQWYHGNKLRGNVALTEVQEVKARDGSIVIQTATKGQFAFVVPPHGASGVMSFFQGLHRLATNESSSLPSPATSIGSSGHNSYAPGLLRQESVPGETATPGKETSIHERRRSIGDKDAGGSSFLTFDDSLRRGILVLKHGRMGRPHPKFLVCDDSLQVLSWIDPAVTNAGFQPPLAAAQRAGRSDKKGILFNDITELLRGKRTRVLQRSTAGRSNTELCFSIVTRTRTLDIETFSREDFALLFDGIQQRVVVRPPTQV